jgi:hypothetical protein
MPEAPVREGHFLTKKPDTFFLNSKALEDRRAFRVSNFGSRSPIGTVCNVDNQGLTAGSDSNIQ